jgi:hypothetical protein
MCLAGPLSAVGTLLASVLVTCTLAPMCCPPPKNPCCPAGISDGLQMGANARAALITRGRLLSIGSVCGVGSGSRGGACCLACGPGAVQQPAQGQRAGWGLVGTALSETAPQLPGPCLQLQGPRTAAAAAALQRHCSGTAACYRIQQHGVLRVECVCVCVVCCRLERDHQARECQGQQPTHHGWTSR